MTSFPTSVCTTYCALSILLISSQIKSLGTFASTPVSRKLRPNAISQRRALGPLSNNNLFSEPATDHGHQRGRSDCSTSPVTRGRTHSRSSAALSPHRRSSLTPANFSPIGKRVASRSASPAQPRKHLKVAQWHNGIAPTGRAKARDYEDTVYHLIVKACHDYEARIGGKHEWPELDTQIAWAQDAWKKACEVVKEEYELTDRILSLVSFSGTLSDLALTSRRSGNGAPTLVENLSTEFAPKSRQLMVSFTVTMQQPSVATRNCPRTFWKTTHFITRYDITNCMNLYSFAWSRTSRNKSVLLNTKLSLRCFTKYGSIAKRQLASSSRTTSNRSLSPPWHQSSRV
jgi:hypothetical protein